MEKHYVITWAIDKFDKNPLAALKKAIEALPTPTSTEEQTIATIFEVKCIDTNETFQIDVLDEGCNPFMEENVENFDKALPESVIKT
jgi:hypothetical protein